MFGNCKLNVAFVKQSGQSIKRMLTGKNRPIAADRDWLLYGRQFDYGKFGCVPEGDICRRPYYYEYADRNN
ncbi:MAG: hypothetical protein WB444_13430, partial [Gallionella sp.]